MFVDGFGGPQEMVQNKKSKNLTCKNLLRYRRQRALRLRGYVLIFAHPQISEYKYSSTYKCTEMVQCTMYRKWYFFCGPADACTACCRQRGGERMRGLRRAVPSRFTANRFFARAMLGERKQLAPSREAFLMYFARSHG